MDIREAIEGLHQEHTLADVAAGVARIELCPDCGQMEIWSWAEIADHGRCRTGPYPCVCDEDYPEGVYAVLESTEGVDRFTVIYAPWKMDDGTLVFPYVTMSALPSHPQGVCQHGELVEKPPVIREDEEVIVFARLPDDCKKVVEYDLGLLNYS